MRTAAPRIITILLPVLNDDFDHITGILEALEIRDALDQGCLAKRMGKTLAEVVQILFMAARGYLKDVMNGKATIPTKAWKAEYAKLTAERNVLDQRYLALKAEVKEAKQIRKSVYSILQQEQREQAQHRTQDMER